MNSANLSIPDMKRRLAALLLEKSYREGHFVLASGRESDFYFDGQGDGSPSRGRMAHRGTVL